MLNLIADYRWMCSCVSSPHWDSDRDSLERKYSKAGKIFSCLIWYQASLPCPSVKLTIDVIALSIRIHF
jgi:hypothetical protein